MMAADSFTKQYVVGKTASRRLLKDLKSAQAVQLRPGNLVPLEDLAKRFGK